MLKNENIIYFSGQSWNSLHQRQQQLSTCLARRNNVVFVDPIFRFGHVKWNLQRFINLYHPRRGTYKISTNLTLFKPRHYLPYDMKFSSVWQINYTINRQSLRTLVAQHFSKPIVIFSRPEHIAWLGEFDRKLLCYDCLDYYAEFGKKDETEKKKLLELEKRLATLADIVFVTSDVLLSRLKEYNQEIHLINNGVDFEHFAKENDKQIPSDMLDIPHPIIGFIGAVARWLDCDLIEYLVSNMKNCSFVFIGPVDINLERFRRYPNIHFLGRKAYEMLPNYLHTFDVCTIPFQINELTNAVNPVKLYEYLAAGKPVVSTPFLGVKGFSNHISFGATKEEFCTAIYAAFSDSDPVKRAERIAFARENSWDHRVRHIEELLSNSLNSRCD